MMDYVTIKKFLSFLIISLFLTGAAYAQQTVKGTVTSEDDGKPLPGVNISVKGTTTGTSTNAQGSYSINVPDTSNVLVFSFIGFETQEIQINGRQQIDVAMATQVLSSGEELVVVGYGTQQKSDLTGSVSSVDAEEVTKVSTGNLQDALQGKVSGVQITPSSGRPGAQPNVRIRGVGTLNNSSPLYVVDGMLLDDISFLNPSDVRSVEVLKDASATAIYGSRGANGVVIVTTKSGRAGEPVISASAKFGYQQVADRIDITNASEYAALANESAENEGRGAVFSNPDQFGAGTNWQDVIFDEWAPQQNYQVTASGGTDNFVYNVSGNFFKQQGVVQGSDYRRLSLRVNNEYFLTDNINIGHNIAFTYNDSDQEADVINLALTADPTVPARNEDGTFANSTVNGGSANPAAAIAFNNNGNNGFRTVGDIYLNIDFLEHFNFRSSFGLDLDRGERKTFTPQFFVSPLQQTPQSSILVRNNNSTNWLNENTLKYQQDFGDHGLNLLAGITFQQSTFEDLQGQRVNVLGSDRNLFYLDAGQTDGQTNENPSEAWGIISYLFRANYTYKDRYLFTGTYRIDGSSRFSKSNRYGYFPSVAVGWRISNEPFMENVSLFNNLKLRASWGIIGNDKIDPYGSIATITSNVNAVFGQNEDINSGATQEELGNPELKWEETEQLDIGLEMGFLDDRLTAEVDWYRKETQDILLQVPIPNYVGIPNENTPFVNAASVLNRGFDFALNWQSGGEDFSYSVGLTGSTVHNEVLKLGGGREEILGGNVRNLGFATRTVPGQPIGAFYGWKTIGVFQDQAEIDNAPNRGVEQPGDLRFADLNGFDDQGNLTGEPDGLINEADKTFLGSPIPDFIFGINLSGAYKQFDLSLAFDGQMGNEILYARQAIRGFRLLNYDSFYLDRWTGPGTSNSEPRVTESGHNYEATDRFLYDGDFIRLRNLQIGYTLPVNITNTLRTKSIRVFANATNLFTITNYVGYNPQIGAGEGDDENVTEAGIDNGVYPISSVYTLGIELSF